MKRLYNTINRVSVSNTESSNENHHGNDIDLHMQLKIRKPHFLKKGKASTFEATTTIQQQVELKRRNRKGQR